MELFDAHTHLDMRHYRHDRDQVVKRAKEAGLVGMVTCSIGPGSFRRTLGLLKKYSGFVYHSSGTQVSRLTKDEASSITDMTRKYAHDIVAVGEVGLDYHWVKDENKRELQKELFLDFIDLAKELHLPLVIHSREAEADATDILEDHFDGEVLMHCFEGSPEVARRIRDNGWYITLPANFDKYPKRREAAEIMTVDQIMLETDGPYLSPTDDRNEPTNIRIGCEKLANHLDMPQKDVAEITTRNATDFYRL
jgi:TatD DNase family protein